MAGLGKGLDGHCKMFELHWEVEGPEHFSKGAIKLYRLDDICSGSCIPKGPSHQMVGF